MFRANLLDFVGGLAVFERGVGSPERAWFTRYQMLGESEGLELSAVLPRWGKTNVPARK